ncbi:hypothetical protein Q9Q95_04710 [Sphingomonas sp. DG1-23]|uniref:hypothetical protein n=1 Tax=Sphingomonas sp. DG1-23 TaxID=3068316 RepID=UPI00273E1AAE|nr:hypothetical protein [Sphingomonas sp. DG1-23]MDP5278216.1 hypothetical protein [Sphingomonas sp. DG1-23]
MKRVLIGVAFALLAAMPGAANAQDAWAMQRKILYLYPTAGGFSFKLDGAQVNPGSPCDANRMILPLGAPNYDAIIGSIMLAFSSNYVVDVAYDSSTVSSCDTVVNRVVVYRRA